MVIFCSRKTALTRFLCSALFLTEFWLMYFCVISLSILIWGCCYVVVGLCQHTWSTMVTVLLQRPLLRVRGSLLQRRWHPSKTDKVSLEYRKQTQEMRHMLCFFIALGQCFFHSLLLKQEVCCTFWNTWHVVQALFSASSHCIFLWFFFLIFDFGSIEGMGKIESMIKRNMFKCLHVYQCYAQPPPLPNPPPPKVKWRPTCWLNN